MSRTAPLAHRVDAILTCHTAYRSLAELLGTDRTYVPTLDVGVSPDLLLVGAALVRAGRDALLALPDGRKVLASAYEAARPLPIRGVRFAFRGELWHAVRVARSFAWGAPVEGVLAQRWNRRRGEFNATARFLRLSPDKVRSLACKL